MKEDLSLYGNELNYANAIWSAAYVFGQIPSNLILTRVSLLFLLPGRNLTRH
jgi:ACS family pantothenate transporter-like MFS transporter